MLNEKGVTVLNKLVEDLKGNVPVVGYSKTANSCTVNLVAKFKQLVSLEVFASMVMLYQKFDQDVA